MFHTTTAHNRLMEDDIEPINQMLFGMVAQTEKIFGLAMDGLTRRDDGSALQAEEEDAELDQLEVAIDEAVVIFIAKQRPVAHDLRQMLALGKIAGDLERIGDCSVTVARQAIKLNAEPEIDHPREILEMAGMTMDMLRGAIGSYAKQDCSGLQEIVKRDKTVDALNKQVYQKMTSAMESDSGLVTRSLSLLLVARSLERAADHAKVIAETIYYIPEAVDIRHTAGVA